ncbi:MAG: UDP-glucose 4-epimerase GalE [Phycisphaerales bacterium]|nr:UDP-glucose 4-epimerase GalE [Planctomycetota bacterium]MCH8509583.1 UDP-glucose 4-epimerase GalE [Phycisphaerales bacterium]
MRVLVTGGAGYIGSHACQRLLNDGHTVVAIDSLYRGHRAPMDALSAGHPGRFAFIHADIGEGGRIRAALDEHDLDTVMHFGAVAYVGESVDDPLWYYRNNIASAIALLEACDTCRDGRGVDRFIFSSSCATYGDPPEGMIPVPEHCPQHPTSPYGRTKLHFEHILLDYAAHRANQDRPLALTMLRYFNVAGSDRTGLLGEDHTPETHLIPVAIQAAQGKRESMSIFGADYPTPDGTCVRDYVHVEDLIDAHVRAAERVKPGRAEAFNVGIGKGYSVREILDSVRRVSGKDFRVIEAGRRAGDAIALYNDPTKIQRDLGWQAQVTDIDEIVTTAWNWMQAHPDGYGD